MGFGGRVDVTEFGNKESLAFPSPNKYNVKSEFQDQDKGKTFGLSFASYEKVYIPGNREIPIPFTKHFPGPGTYYADRDPSSDMAKLTLRPKGKLFNEGLALNSPKCNQYTPKHALTEQARFAKPTFGFGTKSDFTKAPNDFPGPGTYTPPSFVDKFRKKTRKAQN